VGGWLQLEEGRAGLRKRTITCLAALAGYMPDGMLTGLCEHVITTLQSTKTLEGKRTYVQLIGAIRCATVVLCLLIERGCLYEMVLQLEPAGM
jgi:hypothetical protein